MAKTLTVKQPWAHLICSGFKDIENRSWPTSYRGRLLIHAGANIDRRYREMSILFTPAQWRAMPLHTQNACVAGIFTSSAIIGECHVVDCINNSPSVWAEPGQWHWVLRNQQLYQNPIKEIKGKLSLWEFDLHAHGLAWGQ